MKTILLFLESLFNKHAQSSIEGYQSDLRSFKEYIFKRSKIKTDQNLDFDIELSIIQDLNEADIYAYITYLKQDNNNKQVTINRKISTLKQYFRFLKLNHYIINDIVYDIKPNKANAVSAEILNIDECSKLLNNIKGKNKLRDTVIVMLFLFCGLTVNDVINLKKSNVETEKIYIEKENGELETITINEALKSILNDYLMAMNTSASEFLFSVNGINHISKRTIHQLISKHLKASNLYNKGMTTENLRKTGALLLINYCDINFIDLQTYMGHKNSSSTINLFKQQGIFNKTQIDKNPLPKIKIT